MDVALPLPVPFQRPRLERWAPEERVAAPRPVERAGPGPRRRAAAAVYRRRRLLVAAAMAVSLVLLALPIRVLGGWSPPAAAGAYGSGGVLAAHSVYVVRPGDTLWSIAVRLDPSGDPRPLVSQLAQETGSETVVPGEHLTLP